MPTNILMSPAWPWLTVWCQELRLLQLAQQLLLMHAAVLSFASLAGERLCRLGCVQF
jgi:hypothetical protein